MLEMSNGSGDFSNATTIATVTNQNYRSAWAFDFRDFAFPTNIGGSGFKLRVKSTNPVKVSPSSNSFSYYHYDGSSIILNDYRPVALCGNATSTIKIVPANYSNYKWYKNAVLIQGATTSSLEVSEPGVYFAEVDLGPCNLNIVESISNTVTVSRQGQRDVSITGSNQLSVCAATSHTFEAAGLNASDSVQWFRNNTAVTGVGNFPTYTTPAGNADGTYYFKINQSGGAGCSSQSQNVILTYESGFTVNTASANYTLLLPSRSTDLTITTTATNRIVEWYRNDIAIPSSNDLVYRATQGGIYKALVTNNGGCSAPIFSESFTVEVPSDYRIEIGPSADYSSCQSGSTTLQVQKIIAVAPDGSQIELDSDAIDSFSYQWFKNNQPVTGGTSVSTILSVPDNGIYKISGQLLGASYQSNEFTIELSDIDATTTSSILSICSGGSTELQAIQNSSWRYQWLKNDLSITGANSSLYTATEPGDYRCRIDNFNCTVTGNTLTITEASGFTVNIQSAAYQLLLPGVTPVLSITTTASSPSVEWFRDDVAIPNSNNLNFTATQIGTYKALVTDNSGCATPVFSAVFTVESPEDYKIAVNASSNYVSCQNAPTTMQVTKITAIAPDGSLIDLNTTSIALFAFQWVKDGTPINGAGSIDLLLTLSDSGTYMVQGQLEGGLYDSNEFTVEISTLDPTITTANFSICSEGSTVLLATENPLWNYQWLKNGIEVNGAITSEFLALEAGSYSCRIDDAVCVVTSAALTIVEATEESINISPSSDIELIPGSTQTLSASGGDDYVWTDATGAVLSTTDMVTVDSPGNVNLQTTVGSCVFNSLIIINQTMLGIIPNVITANGDGINEKWVLPPAYRSADTTITIYDTAGTVIYTTSNYQNNWPVNTSGTTNPVYYYTIEKNTSTLKKGTITVLR